MMNAVRIPNNKFMKQNVSPVITKTLLIGIGLSDQIKVHYQFHTMFMQTHQEFLYLKTIYPNVHFRFLDAIGHSSSSR